MGKQLGHRGDHGRASSRSRKVERGRREEEKGKESIKLVVRQKEKEKEEGKEEGKESQKGKEGERQVSREEAGGKKARGMEDSRGPLQQHRIGPQCKEEKKVGTESQKIPGKDQRALDQQFNRQQFNFRGVRGDGKYPSGQEQDTSAGPVVPWLADSTSGGIHEASTSQGLTHWLGAEERGAPSADDVLLQDLSFSESQWGDCPRVLNPQLDSRLVASSSPCRSFGLHHPEAEVFGADMLRCELAVGSEDGANSGVRNPVGQQTGVADRQTGAETGPSGKAIQQCMGSQATGQRQREEQRQGRRQRQEQDEGGRCQEELRKDERSEDEYELLGEGVRSEAGREDGLLSEGGSKKKVGLSERRMQKKDRKLKAEERRLTKKEKVTLKRLLRQEGRIQKLRRRKKPRKTEVRTEAEGRCKVRKIDKDEKLRQTNIGSSPSLPKDGGREACTAATVQAAFFREDPTGHSEELGRDSGLGRSVENSERTDSCEGWFGELYSWLEPRVGEYVSWLCKTSPTGRVFPLPTSSLVLSQLFPNQPLKVIASLRCLVISLNSLNGEGTECTHMASDFQKQVLEGLVPDVVRVLGWKVKDECPSWDEFFRVKGVDYKGEEILSAQHMRWENVSPALPPEVGGVALEEVVEKGCLEYVLNFKSYLLDPEDQVYTKPPRVMVPPDGWRDFCENLLKVGVFSKIHEDDIHRVQGKMLLSGLFGVSKREYHGPHEILRIIMNLIPVNNICRGIDGDVNTLPSWAGMTPLGIDPEEELIISSEDVRAFFYIFRVPQEWHPFLAFNRPLPPELKGDKEGDWYPCSAVLPMGFKNSVSLAQHVHRFIVQKALRKVPDLGGEAELRKDRPFPSSRSLYRIYLDNFDQLERVAKGSADVLKGQVSPLVEALRQEYSQLGVPRHPKKAVAREVLAEVQGAVVDGKFGLAYPKIEKIARYAHLARLLLLEGASTQKQMQVIGGGFVYLAMFRRPLLGSLNHIWKFIVKCDNEPPFIKHPLPKEVQKEIARFLGLIPLAYMDFRCQLAKGLTASDASETGGGVTFSTGVTPAGAMAAGCSVRGDIVEPDDVTAVLTVGLFDGIGALRVAADALNWHVQGHISVECSTEASRVVESRFPNTWFCQDVQEVNEELVRQWAQKYGQVGLVLLGAGPPCQGVSKLNAARKGALKDSRSSLFFHVQRIFLLLKAAFPWAQVRKLMENVSSMDFDDEAVMSESLQLRPWMIDASGVSLARRPRLYWIDWELAEGQGVKLSTPKSGRSTVELHVELNPQLFLEPGWRQVSPGKLPTFTTSRPRAHPGYKPAGLSQCTADERARWVADEHRFPPYQYCSSNCLVNKAGDIRLPSISEREVIMGFPKGYTMHCLPKKWHGTSSHRDQRLTLVGNSWNVTVVTWLLSQMGFLLGLNEDLPLEEVVKRTSPAPTTDLQSFLQRPSMLPTHGPVGATAEAILAKKLLTLVSMKGEDILLQSSSEDLTRYHRLRASIPAKLWRWKAVASWQWLGHKEHINSLEIRAVLTALRWRLERHKQTHLKFIHLVDSLVALHCLSRGRSSSSKLQRTILRINALLLATRSQTVWTYVHTKLNPADAPSRRPLKRKWRYA